MARILFAFDDMNVGGIASVLIRFFEDLKPLGHEITLLLADNKGAWIDKIPPHVQLRLIPFTEQQRESALDYGVSNNIKKNIKQAKFITAIKILLKKLCGDNLAALKFEFADLQSLEGEYDIAVSYQYNNTLITRFVAEKVNSRTKYVWVHNDLTTTKYNYKYTYPYMHHFDKIFCVSKALCEEVKCAYPEYTDRVEVFYNSIDYQKIVKLSEEKQDEMKSNELSILSVGRLDKQKGFDLAVRAAHLLKRKGLVFCWYIIGEGEERKTLERMISKYNVQDCFKLLGRKNNPFKYMRECTIYVQPSRHEGYCTTTNEVKVFGKPVVVTDVAGMDEQYINGETGLIVDTDYAKIANAVESLILNEELREKLAKNVSISSSESDTIRKYF